MEEKSASPAAGIMEANTGSRRRGGGGQKRKPNSNSNNNGSSKRHRGPPPPPHPPSPIPFHNGPLTRAARHLPNLTNPTPTPTPNPNPPTHQPDSDSVKLNQPGNKADLLALEAKIESAYEAINSRDPNLHVVPTHAGWFSWTQIHHLEEQMLPSFFTGKSQTRTPQLYLETRNWIINKFHAHPTQILDLSHLSDLTVADEEAKLEVMEFLDYWGLINFHPHHHDPSDATTDHAHTHTHTHTQPEDASLLKSLYRFQTQESWTPLLPTTTPTTPSMPSGIIPDSALPEDLVKSEEPSVEYHCNSCSADCSRKRYHCQMQADFDLCTECFNNSKFGPDMSPSDFILMEPAEAGGASGGKWTDQETLLLLEALELYKENWNEIAEHVATKTKAQCILHFVEMPIEDAFLNCDDETIEPPEENNVGVSLSNASPVGVDGPERAEDSKQGTDELPSSPKAEISKTDDLKGSNILESGDVSKNFALEALKEAFEAVGTPLPREQMSFTNAGNPVMTLAAFLVRLVEPDIAAAVVRNSLKLTSVSSRGELLALRHCFVLEDPPDEKGQTTGSERNIAEAAEQDSLEDVNKTDTRQTVGSVDNCYEDDKTEENHKSNTEIPDSNDQNNGVNETSNIQEEKHPLDPPNQSLEKLDSEKILANEGGETPDSGKSSDQVAEETNDLNSINVSKKQTDKPDELDVSSSNVELLNSANNSENLTTLRKPTNFEGSLKHETVTCTSDKKESDHLSITNTLVGEGKTGTRMPNDDENGDPSICKTDSSVDKLKQAAITALSAAAVKAKFLARQEEEQIQQLAALVIENQMYKLEAKLSFFNEMENVVARVREQLERSKQKLYHERAQIIASRLGISGSASRPISQPSQINRAAMAFANLAPRSPFIGTSLRPPMSRPMMGSGSSLLGAIPGSSVQPSNQDKLPSVTNK